MHVREFLCGVLLISQSLTLSIIHSFLLSARVTLVFLVFNVMLSFLLLGQLSSRATLACLGIVLCGFLVGSFGEVNFSMRGTLAGIISSLFVSLNSIFTKKILPVVKDNHVSA